MKGFSGNVTTGNSVEATIKTKRIVDLAEFTFKQLPNHLTQNMKLGEIGREVI